MATIINNPNPSERITTDDGSTGVVLGILVVLLLVFLFIIFGLPYLRQAAPANNGNVTNPQPGADINVQVNPGNLGNPGPSGDQNPVTPR